jgi:hypothetical protein
MKRCSFLERIELDVENEYLILNATISFVSSDADGYTNEIQMTSFCKLLFILFYSNVIIKVK